MAGARAKKDRSNASDSGSRRGMRIEEGAQLSREILHCATRGLTRMDFLREVSSVLMEFCGCDAV